MQFEKLKLIDCTIRDGGHINKWQFDESLVKASYFAATKAGMDYFEIGYKNDPAVRGLGAFGYSDDAYISQLLKTPTATKLLCMIDAGKYTGYKVPQCDRKFTPLSGIRIAAYNYEIDIALELIKNIHDKGYEVFLQLMASSEWTDKEYITLEKWNNKDLLSAIYFADSFGSFVPSDITQMIGQLKKLGFSNIGFHAHNSLQMAFANAIQAVNDGATYIDASIYGMGRGAGNLPIEILLGYLGKLGNKKYNVVPYLDVIERFYIDLSKKESWGYSLESLLGGIRNLHPYYIAELFKSNNYTVEEIWNIIDSLKEKCPVSFSGEKLNNELKNRFYVPTVDYAENTIKDIEAEIKIIPAKDSFPIEKLTIAKTHPGKKFLVIANGPSASKYKTQIDKLIEKEKPVTIGCNYLKQMYSMDYHIFVNRKRFLKYARTIDARSTLILPSFFGAEIVKDNYNGKIEYIQIDPTDDLKKSPIEGIAQKIVFLNVAISAILTAYQMGAEQIMVCGMDGYEKDNAEEMVYFYNENDVPHDKITASLRYENLALELRRISDFMVDNAVPFSIITPTSHKQYYQNIF